jgi:ubiquitin C-terminal hydrolase
MLVDAPEASPRVVTVSDSSPVKVKVSASAAASRKRRGARGRDDFVVSDDESVQVSHGSDDDDDDDDNDDDGEHGDDSDRPKKRGRPKRDKSQPNITNFFQKRAGASAAKKKPKRGAKVIASESEADDTEERDLARALAESAAAAGVSVASADVDAEDNHGGRVPIGLNNMGATCYVNVLLQCLFANVPFRAAVYRWRHASEPDGPSGGVLPPPSERNSRNAIYQLQRVFAHLQLQEDKSFRSNSLIDMLELEHNYQQDVQEFLVHVLDRYSAFLGEASDELRAVRRVPEATFGISLMHQTTCATCGRISTHHEPVMMLAVNVSKSLQASLAESFVEERLEGDNRYYCERCDEKREASRALRLKELPPYLVIHIKRFSFDMKTLSRKKLHDVIEFPHQFDPNGLIVLADAAKRGDDAADVADADLALAAAFRNERDGTDAAIAAALAASDSKGRSSKRNPPGPQYALVATVDHKGSNAGGGHYVSTVFDPIARSWSLFDDSVVKSVNDSFAKRQMHKSADVYLLVYRLIPGGGVSPLSLPVAAPEVPPYLLAEIAAENDMWRGEESRRRAESDAANARDAESQATFERIAPLLLLGDLPRSQWALAETSYLRAWAKEPLTKREMAPTKLLCTHDALDPRAATQVKAVARAGFEALAELRRTLHHVDDARLLQQNDVCAPCLVLLADMLRREAQYRLDVAALVLEFRQPKKGTIDAVVAQIDDACDQMDDDQSVWVSMFLITLWERAARAEAKLPPSTTRPLSQRLAKVLGVAEFMAPPPDTTTSTTATTTTAVAMAVDLTVVDDVAVKAESTTTDDVVVLAADATAPPLTASDETIAKQLQLEEEAHGTFAGSNGASDATPEVEIDPKLYEGASDARRLARTIGTRGVLPAGSTFTTGLVCQHGQLSAAVKARKVSRRVWNHLVETYGDDAGEEVHGSTTKCDACSEFQTNDEKQKRVARSLLQKFKTDQKQSLERLVARIDEPVYERDGGGGVFHAVPRLWYEQWAAFVNSKSSLQVPGPIDARSLLCHHGRTMYEPSESVYRPTLNRVRFVVVTDDEWSNLGRHFGAADIEAEEALPPGALNVLREADSEPVVLDGDDARGPSISSLRAMHGGRRELVDVVYDKSLPSGVSPALCAECVAQRREVEQVMVASFESSFINLHRLPAGVVPHLTASGTDAGDAAAAVASTLTFDKAAAAAGESQGDQIAFFIDRKAGVVAVDALLSAAVASGAANVGGGGGGGGSSSVTAAQRRRTTRRNVAPKAISNVSSSMAIANLKMLVCESVEIEPARQRLFLMAERGGAWRELLDNNTLADHGVRAGASIMLVERPADNDAQMAAIAKQAGPEKGFSGTWLGGGGSLPNGGSSHDLLASAGAAATSMAVDDVVKKQSNDDDDGGDGNDNDENDGAVQQSPSSNNDARIKKQEDDDARLARKLATVDNGAPAASDELPVNGRVCGACTYIEVVTATKCSMCDTQFMPSVAAAAGRARARPKSDVIVLEESEKKSGDKNKKRNVSRRGKRAHNDDDGAVVIDDDDDDDDDGDEDASAANNDVDDEEENEGSEESNAKSKSKRRKAPGRKPTVRENGSSSSRKARS